jgi:hypothetical protein
VKNLLIDCDQVFDVLTRGPFPSGSPDDDGVEHHLRACHECRQLAEALRPAVALLHEAVTADEASHLPGYQGSLPAIAALSPAATAYLQAPVRRAAHGYSQSLAAVRFLAASILVAALSLLVYSFTMLPGAGSNLPSARLNLAQDSPPSDLADGVPDPQGLAKLASLQLPVECFSPVNRRAAQKDPVQIAAALTDGSIDALRCCTECHRAGAGSVRGGQFVAVVKESCQACHRS